MVHFKLSCPKCEYRFEIDVANQKPYEFHGFRCTECGHKGMTLLHAEVGSEPATREAIADLERRVSEMENYLADHTSDEDVPFQPADLQ